MVYIGIFNEYAVLWNTETYFYRFIGEEKVITNSSPSLFIPALFLLVSHFFPFTPLFLPLIHRYH